MKLLEVEGLCVDYDGEPPVRAVNDVSFAIDRGEVLGLAGESGSGKSTIAQAIVRILQPPAVITDGAIRWQGRDVLDMGVDELRRFRWREVALVMQSAVSALNPVLEVGEQIVDAIRAHEAVTRKVARERAAELLDRVGVGARRIHAFPHQLSGGMRQRVGIAMALALDPKLLILDEPTTALDAIVQREILDELTALRSKSGFAVLFVSHDLGLLFELCDRIAVMQQGAIVEHAPSAELWKDAKHPYTRRLLQSVQDLRPTGT